jgi:hypothetical protein
MHPSLEVYYKKEIRRLMSATKTHVRYTTGGVSERQNPSEACIFGSCLQCAKKPAELGGFGKCKLFSLYRDKTEVVGRAIDFDSGCVSPGEPIGGYALVDASGVARYMTSTQMANMMSKAPKVSASSLAGKFFEKQVWSESGKLAAVKVDRRWKALE